jgi:DNA-binding YbaB/EbfC family protein
MFKGLSNLTTLFKQAQELGGRMRQMNEELKNQKVVGSAGGAMVEIEVNGLMEVLACRIQPQLFHEGDRELIEDLVTAATNQAIAKARELHAGAMKQLSGNLNLELPGLNEALTRLMGGASDDSSQNPKPTETP